MDNYLIAKKTITKNTNYIIFYKYWLFPFLFALIFLKISISCYVFSDEVPNPLNPSNPPTPQNQPTPQNLEQPPQRQLPNPNETTKPNEASQPTTNQPNEQQELPYKPEPAQENEVFKRHKQAKKQQDKQRETCEK